MAISEKEAVELTAPPAPTSAPARGGGVFGSMITDENYMWWAAVPVIMGLFIVIMDSSIVNVALPHIMSAFGSSIEDIEWVSTGYMLSSAVMMPTTGFLGERFGQKRLYVLAIFLFTVASVLCGMAWDANSLIAFRVLQGIVGGAIQPVGQAIIFAAFPPEKRGMSMAIVGIGAMFAPMVGPTIGGYLVDYLNWRWIFYVNLPIGLLATFMAWAILRKAPRHPVKFDASGFTAMALFLTTLLYGVSEGNSKGWDSDLVMGCFAVAFVSFCAFIVIELWRTKPVVELRLFKYFTYSAGTLTSIAMGIGLFGGMFLLPLFLQNLMGYDAIQTGLIMMPQGLAVAVMMPITAALMTRMDPRYLMFAGFIMIGGSLMLQGGMSPDTSTATIIGWTIIRGMGMGLAFPSMNQTALAAVPIQQIGQASGLFNVTRQIGGSFGIALLSTVLTQRTVFQASLIGQSSAHTGGSTVLMSHVRAMLIAHGVNPGLAQMQAASVWGQLAMKEASVRAFQDTFFFAGALMLVGLIPILFMRKKPAEPGGEAASHAMVME